MDSRLGAWEEGRRGRETGGPQAAFSSSCDSATLTLFLSRDTAHEIRGISFAECAQRCAELFERRGTLPVVKLSQVMADKIMTLRRDKLGESFDEAGDALMLAVNRSMAVFLGFA